MHSFRDSTATRNIEQRQQFVEIFNAHSSATARALQQFPHASVPPPPPALLRLVGSTVSLDVHGESYHPGSFRGSSREESQGHGSPGNHQVQRQQQSASFERSGLGTGFFPETSIHSLGNGGSTAQSMMVMMIVVVVAVVVVEVVLVLVVVFMFFMY